MHEFNRFTAWLGDMLEDLGRKLKPKADANEEVKLWSRKLAREALRKTYRDAFLGKKIAISLKEQHDAYRNSPSVADGHARYHRNDGAKR